jgi:DNA-binding CsgD family transcriptional regulator
LDGCTDHVPLVENPSARYSRACMRTPSRSVDRPSIQRGRDAELDIIGEKVSATRQGSGGIVLIDGSPGLGKSRMLEEAAAMAARHGLRPRVGANLPDEQTIYMGALTEVLFDEPEPLFPRSARGSLDTRPEQRFRLLEQIEALLERAALDAPLLLGFDDMQWADSGCRAAIRALPRALRGLPILFVLAFRGDDLSPELRDAYAGLERLGAVRLILKPLNHAAVAEIIRDVLGAQPDAALRELVDGAHGSPFLITELLHGLIEDGLVRTESGQAQLVEARLPTRVRSTMRDRLQGLSSEARHTAQVASVLGGGFSFGWLAAMLDRPPSTLLGPVDELIGADLLTTRVDGQLAFRHELLREAVLDTLPGSTRRALQRQAADVLMDKGAPALEVVGLLRASAERGDQAAVAAMLRAVEQLALDDPGAAADLGRRALELAPPGDPNRGSLVAQTALLLYAADRTAEGQSFASSALGAALSAEEEAWIRLSIAQMYTLDADIRAAHGRAALGLSDVSTEVRARHLAWLSNNLLGAGRVADARELMDEAQPVIDSANDERANLGMVVATATLDFVDGRYSSALRRLEQAAQLPASAGNRNLDPAIDVLGNDVLASVDRLDEALEASGERLRAASRDRQSYAVRAWEQCRGRRLLQQGRLADAAAALEGTISDDAMSRTAPGADAPAVVALGRVALHTSDIRLTDICGAIAATMLEAGPPEVRRQAAWLLMLQALAISDATAVASTLDLLGRDGRISVLPQIRYDPLDEPQLVRVALAADDERLADLAVEAAEHRRALNPDVASLAAAAAHARGLRIGDIAELTNATAIFQQATPRPMARASALEDLGRAHLQAQQRDQAVAALGTALELYAAAGATWDAGRARGRLRELGVRRRLTTSPRSTVGWLGLTTAEVTVVELVAQGRTNREVASHMFLSPHTVSMHLRHAFTKLGINSRVELARIVVDHQQQHG